LTHESFLSPEIYEIAEQIDESGHDSEVFEVCLDCLGKIDFQSLYEYVNNFITESDEDFVQEFYQNDIPFNLSNFVVIDWEATARNIMYDILRVTGIISVLRLT
jgi:hypothetical protein